MTRIIPFIAAALFILAGPAQAEHARVGSTALYRSASQLEAATDHVLQRVAHRARRGHPNARQALAAVRDLDVRAERFREKLGRNVNSPKKLRKLHDRVEYAFRHAQDCARELRMHRLLRDLDRVRTEVRRLDRQIDRVQVARYERRHDNRHDVRRGSHNDRYERYERRDRRDRHVASRLPWFWGAFIRR